ncbi:MAG TPA: hypothetical protein VFQ61_27215 [Polyangiaceae bacterium]|nr:hypothetical protein [Polyangiaceae bacterium]
MDLAFLVLLAASFGAWVATHVALALWLFRQKPRFRAGLALILPPLAPYWGLRGGLRGPALRLSLLWLISGFTYLISLIAGRS